MQTLKRLLLGSFLITFALLVHGHGTESDPISLHGGHAVKAGSYNLELVVEDAKLRLYVNDDHNQPVASQGAKAEAIVLSNKKKTKMALNYQENNELSGTGDYALDPRMKVILHLQMPGEKRVTARFTPLEQ